MNFKLKSLLVLLGQVGHCPPRSSSVFSFLRFGLVNMEHTTPKLVGYHTQRVAKEKALVLNMDLYIEWAFFQQMEIKDF